MIGQSLSNINETCYSIQIAKIYNLNKALASSWAPATSSIRSSPPASDLFSVSCGTLSHVKLVNLIIFHSYALYIKMCSQYFSPFALTGESLGWASECFSDDFSVCVHLYNTSAPLLCATLSPMYICFPTFYLHAWLPSLGDSTLTELSSQKRLSWLQYVLFFHGNS